MNAAIGSAGVVIGLLGAIFGIVTIAVGLHRGTPLLLRRASSYAWLVLAGGVIAAAAMERALITRDFSVQFVADNGSSLTPALYNVATLWGALEGSIILWSLILGGYTVLVARKFRHRLEDPLVAWAMLTMFVVATFFFGLMMGPADPFVSVSVPAGFDGQGPNPLLQNHPLMAFHPPMLYLGYVGFTVPFAFAIAALITGRVGEGWLLETRRWTLFAWGFLTVGIALGSWWAYEVLGWGGYWGWDPVENASLLPWLTGTAYIHSVMVQERRGMLRVWNLALLCATFALTILGTLITRSGVLVSVHAFSDGTIGPILLGFFALIVLVSVVLIGWRGDRLRSPGSIDSPLSREGAFLANNVLFGAFAFVVLLGTVFPLVVEAWNGETIRVGEPYFERMSVPIGLALLTLMAIAPVLPWRATNVETLAQRLQWPAWLGAGVLVLALALGERGLGTLAGYGLAGFAAGSALRQVVLATRRQGWRGLVGRANGGMIVHLGVILVAVGIIASNANIVSREARLEEGESFTVAGHELQLLSVREEELPRLFLTTAEVRVDGEVHEPAVEVYKATGQTIPTPSVKTSWDRDVAVTLSVGDWPDGPVQIRAVVQPLISWMWTGAGLMALGTLLAAFPGRRRRPTDPVSAPLATIGAAR
ncbi:heme lyase CcmF/NrfE family subunit [Actinomarinicola tropica]|uniref:Heme lyase CcmF/NrfE family subunit n=1 Tax=Actinomarinicola tropica TaxID=2789776 RepID=A0A5Q2RFQ3_9ACTN|nr:heme lyase CcmF/NrfE family subunit [Actinomarinicola tropica]QGG94533.1 heme lyase CcmF/NrfE family subunit [Actinomarinicola tropica]